MCDNGALGDINVDKIPLLGPLTIALLLPTLVLACNGDDLDSVAPEDVEQTAATQTAEPDIKKVGECKVELPDATLRYGDSLQAAPTSSFAWRGPECTVQGHGINELRMPADPVVLPVGARPRLSLSRAPTSLRAFVWTPSFESPTPVEGNIIEVLLEPNFSNRNELRIDIDIEAVSSQELPLDALPPGDYAVEVIGGWPEGGVSFIARVKIEAP